MQETLQIVIAILGILSQILLLGREFFHKQAASGKDLTELTRAEFVKTAGNRNLLDLSFVLICAAFFALLLTDSLIFSGKNPSPGPWTILAVLLITSVVVVTMCGAWFLRASELVTGFLAVTTFVVLIISRGGPFVPSESDSTAALSLLVPVFSLVVLASAMFIYAFGNPLSRVVPKRKRMAVSITLSVLVVVAAGALGMQLLQNVANNEKSPKVNTPEAKDLLRRVMSGSLRERRSFYRFASEASLARTYGDYYRKLLPSQMVQSTNAGEPAAPIAPRFPKTGATPPSQSASPRLQTSVSPSPAGVTSVAQATPSPKKETSIAEVEALKDLVNQAYREDDYTKAINLQQALNKIQSIKGPLRDGVGRVKFLGDCFSTVDAVAREKFMTDRLEWIHPVGLEGQSEAVIQLPGTDSQKRFDYISTLRIVKTLHDQAIKRQEMIAEFSYPDDVLNYFKEREPGYSGWPRIPEELYKPTLFPKLESTTMDSRLEEQLSLPRPEEAFLTFKEYKLLAVQMLKQDLSGKMETADIDKLSATFVGLDDAAQDAFRNYVIDNKKLGPERVYKMLLALTNVDFEPLTSSQDPLAVEKLLAMLNGSQLPENPELQQIANDVRTKVEGKDDRDTLIELLRNENSDVPIRRLFQKPVFDLISQLHRNLGQSKTVFFDAVADPVWLVVKHLAHTSAVQTAARTPNDVYPLDNYLQEFRVLPEDAQGGILLQLAISLYQPGGPHSLDPARLLVSQALAWSDRAALVCASLLTVPVLLLAVLAGGFFSRKLVARDRTRQLIAEELTETPSPEITLGRPVDLYGREETLNSLRGLAERGWSTIGVVGRRGVGKSRILYALSRESTDENSATVRVWVSSPSRFQEEDFIHSIFERLALSAEAAIGAFLGAKPLSIRKIESRNALLGSLFYTSAWIVLAVIVFQMYNRLTRADIVVTWLPILALVCASMWFFFSYLAKLQPVDLSTWLQRDRTHNSHTVILYREVYEVLKLLRRRSRDISDAFAPRRTLIKMLVLTTLGIIFVGSTGALLILLNERAPTTYYLTTLIILISSFVAWVYLYRRLGDDRTQSYGSSIMSLIADYRSFVNSMVYRLRQGALGHREGQKFPVLICIDELDKVVDFEEIRAFVRRIKAIFEVPGVYYYVSLAEDTLTALYLGPAEGKNEIDSAFDHIVRIAPLSCEAGEAIASQYLESHGHKDGPVKLARTIATVSFGVPRDIIRRCDELFTLEGCAGDPQKLVLEMRTIQLNMGYELKQVSKSQIAVLEKDYVESALQARTMFETLTSPIEQRLILYIWLLCLVEAALDLSEGPQWLDLTKQICEVGYKLPTDSVIDLHSDLERIHAAILAQPMTAGGTLPRH